MEQTSLPQQDDLYIQGDFWRLRWRMDSSDANSFVQPSRPPAWIGPATGPERLTKEQAEQIAWENFLSRLNQTGQTPQSTRTIADFVENTFIPEHVATKRAAGRTHYQAILKHVLTPEEVDRMFHADADQSRTKLKAIPNWPYLGSVRLYDVGPDHIQRLIRAAQARGYSTQTVRHIRNVVSAIFEHARKKQWFNGENPASLVTPPAITRKEAHALTLTEIEEMLRLMRYPEKEMALIAILTNMNLAEICGLQWKCVNLTDAWLNQDGEAIPARTIAVRKQWRLGELSGVQAKSRRRNIPIPEPLLPVLLELSHRAKFTGFDDFVLVSRAGTPVSGNRVAACRLKPIGKALEKPWLSWQVFRRTHARLAYELGARFQDYLAVVAY